jgi:hypothetical protein
MVRPVSDHLAVFCPVNRIDLGGLQRHLLGILSEVPGFVDIGGLCGNTHQA